MKRTVLMVVMLLLAVSAPPALAQPGQQSPPAPRRIAFAEAATIALQGNLQLKAAAFEVAVAEAQLGQARGLKGPQVGVSASYTRTQQQAGQTITFPNPFGPVPPFITIRLPAPDPNIVLARLSLQYPLYTGGRLEAQIALAEANLRGARAALERTKQQVAFVVQQTYLQGLLAAETVTAAERASDQAAENLRVARARVQTGVSPQFDALQAEVAVANAGQALVRAQSGARQAEAVLNALLGLPQDTPLVLTETLTPRPVTITLQEAIARGVTDRPEVAEIQSRIAAARAAMDIAASGGKPNVGVALSYDYNPANPLAVSGWSLTFALTLSLFDGGITRERMREAELRLEQLKVLEAQTRQRIELEVRQAWLALEQAGAEVAAATKAVEAAREAARIARVRYEAGLGTSLEVLSAQAALAQADVALAAARFSQNLARIQLLLATGGSV